jgi:hypothetical protein
MVALAISGPSLLIAQPGPSTLTTTFASNNGQAGNMFDLDSFFPVDILGFDINVDPGVHDVEVWAKTAPGSFSGSILTPGDWTLIGNYTGITSAGEDQPTPLPPFATPVRIAPGSTQAFYVTLVNSTDLNYTNGSNPGGLFATDGVLNFYEGVGVIYPFGNVFNPRVWNGNIHYQVVGPPQPEYQVNQPGATLELMGVQGDELNVASSFKPYCEPVTVSWTGSASALTYDIAVTEAGRSCPAARGPSRPWRTTSWSTSTSPTPLSPGSRERPSRPPSPRPPSSLSSRWGRRRCRCR